MFFAEIDYTIVVPIAVFGFTASAVWLLSEMMASRNLRAEERLQELRDPRMRRNEKTASDAMAKMLEKASPALAKPLQPKSETEAGKLRQRLSHAGFRRESAPGVFLSVKVVFLLLGLFFSGGTMLFVSGLSKDALMKSIAAAGFMFYLPDGVLWLIASNRKQKIFLGLPDALDLMVVCVEAGLGLDQAMRKVAEEMVKSYRVIADEFALCNFQLQMGRQRKDVLHELGQRTGVDDLRSLASVLIQAEKFGASVGQALRVQSDSMRTRRRQLAEEKAAKTAVQLIFPLVLFIFPGIFVVLVGPAAITMVREMFPAMRGN